MNKFIRYKQTTKPQSAIINKYITENILILYSANSKFFIKIIKYFNELNEIKTTLNLIFHHEHSNLKFANILSRILPALNNLFFRKKKKKKKFNISNFGPNWRRVKRYIRFFKKKLKKTKIIAQKLIKKDLFNDTNKIGITSKYKPSYRIYKWKRKKFFFLKQLFKQRSQWTANQQSPAIRTNSTLIKYTHNLLRDKITHNYVLLLVYKKKKHRKLHKRRKKNHFLFNRLIKNKSAVIKNRKQQKFITSYIYTPLKWTTSNVSMFILDYKMYHKNIDNININIPNFKSFLIKENPPAAPKWIIGYHQKKKKQMNYISTKKVIFTSLFEFYDSSMAINNRIATNYINKNALLKIPCAPTNKELHNVLKINSMKTKVHNKHNNYINLNVLASTQPRTCINNFYPLIYFLLTHNSQSNTNAQSISMRKLYYSQITPLAFRNYKNFYSFFLLNFLEQFLKKKAWIRADIRDVLSYNFKKYIDLSLHSNARAHKRFIRLISVKELLEIIILMFISRDLQIFLCFIKICFERSHFKKHKKILSILFDVFRKNKILLHYMGVKGFFFDIRGKVGVSGNAKKRHLFFSLGKITTTSQNIRSYWQQINVWTPTGQMGITCCILY